MGRLIVLLIAALTALLIASPRLAQANPADEHVSMKYLDHVGWKEPMTAALKMVTGQVASVDHASKILTVRKTGWRLRGKLRFAVEEQAAGDLADLKHGDWVDITYTEAWGRLIAQTIVKRESGEKPDGFRET